MFSKTWYGSIYGFGDITQENTMVIAAVFDGDSDYVVETATSPNEALAVIQSLEKYQVKTAVVITGYFFSEINGVNFIKIINKKYPRIKTILLAWSTGGTWSKADSDRCGHG